MNQAQFDTYRQQVWNQGAAIVDEHDGQGQAGTLTNVAVNGLISRLGSLMDAFRAEYQASRQPRGPIASGWIDSRFHDYYDFFANVLAAWRQEVGGVAGTTPPYVPPFNPGGSVTPGGLVQRTIYRMILFVPDRGIYGTSGTYPECTPNTPGGCQGQEFPNVQAAVDYARAHDETPVYIDSDYDSGVDEAWRLAAGGSPQAPKSYIVEGVNPTTGEPVLRAGFSLASIPPVAIGVGLLALAVVFGGKRKS